VGAHALARSDPQLASVISFTAASSVVPSVRSSYKTALKFYREFCINRGLELWPVDDVQLAGFIHITVQHVSVDSLKMYLAGVRYHHENEWGAWTLEGNELIRRTKRYVKRHFPGRRAKHKLPISLRVLCAILPLLPGWPDALSLEDLMFATASLLAMAAFLRGGEAFTSEGQSRTVMTREMFLFKKVFSCGVETMALIVNVPQPKATPGTPFVAVPVFECPEAGAFDPVRMWKAYVARSPTVYSTQPAFTLPNGKSLSRDYMVKRTLSLLAESKVPMVDSCGNPLSVMAASWRAGGVRTAVDAGVPEYLIMQYGRWRSHAWKHYLCATPLDLYGSALKMFKCLPVEATSALLVGDAVAAQLGVSEDCVVMKQAAVSLRARVRIVHNVRPRSVC
jgi:hypothetical protein